MAVKILEPAVWRREGGVRVCDSLPAAVCGPTPPDENQPSSGRPREYTYVPYQARAARTQRPLPGGLARRDGAADPLVRKAGIGGEPGGVACSSSFLRLSSIIRCMPLVMPASFSMSSVRHMKSFPVVPCAALSSIRSMLAAAAGLPRAAKRRAPPLAEQCTC